MSKWRIFDHHAQRAQNYLLPLHERAEIVTLSWWKDNQSIAAFAGKEIDRARYFPEDDRYLPTRPETVQHYESTEISR